MYNVLHFFRRQHLGLLIEQMRKCLPYIFSLLSLRNHLLLLHNQVAQEHKIRNKKLRTPELPNVSASFYYFMDPFGSVDPAALAVAVFAALYAMKATLSDWNEKLEVWIGNAVLSNYQKACAPKGSRTVLSFLTHVGNPEHSRYGCDGVTIKELIFANKITKDCQIWKMAWWMDILLVFGLVIQIFPPPIRVLMWAMIIMISSPIAGITKGWDEASSGNAYENLGQYNGYSILLECTSLDYMGKEILEDGIRMFALRTIIALGFGDDLGALGLLKLCTPSASYTREDFLTHVAVAVATPRYYKAGLKTFSSFPIQLDFDPVEVWYGQVKVKSTKDSKIAVDGFSNPAGSYTALGLGMSAKWLATAESVKPMIPFISWVLRAAKDAQISKDTKEEYEKKQLAWRLVDTCIIISSAVSAAFNKEDKKDTEGIYELEMLLKPWFHQEFPFYRPLFEDMNGWYPWCAKDHRLPDCLCNCLALPYEAVSLQAVVGQNFNTRVPTVVICKFEKKAYEHVIYGGYNAVRLGEHNLQDFILGDNLCDVGIIVAGKSFSSATCTEVYVGTVTVQVQA